MAVLVVACFVALRSKLVFTPWEKNQLADMLSRFLARLGWQGGGKAVSTLE